MMKNAVLIGCVAAVAGLALQTATAADPDISKLPPAAKKDGLTFDKDIKPLLEASTEEVMRHFVLTGYDPHPAINFKVAV